MSANYEADREVIIKLIEYLEEKDQPEPSGAGIKIAEDADVRNNTFGTIESRGVARVFDIEGTFVDNDIGRIRTELDSSQRDEAIDLLKELHRILETNPEERKTRIKEIFSWFSDHSSDAYHILVALDTARHLLGMG